MNTIFERPLTKEQEAFIRTKTRISGGGSFKRPYVFHIKKEDKLNLSCEEIQTICGYHPAGYGTPYDVVETKDMVEFKCWGTCD